MSDDRFPCGVCGRCFNPESLVHLWFFILAFVFFVFFQSRHEKICQKTVSKKPRKIFDSGKQRAAGSDVPYTRTLKPMPTYNPAVVQPQEVQRKPTGKMAKFAPRQNEAAQPRKNNWRKQHEEFIQAVRAAKAYGRAVQTGGPLPPPPPPSENPGL